MEGLLAAIVLGILIGIAANNADRFLFGVLSNFRDSIKNLGSADVDELSKALKRSVLSARQQIALDCLKELPSHKMFGIFPKVPSKHQEELKWLSQKWRQLARELKQLKQGKAVETSLALSASFDEIVSLREPSSLSAANENVQSLTEKMIAEALKDNPVPQNGCYAQKIKTELFGRVRNCFATEMRDNQVVHDIFREQLLIQLNARLRDKPSTMKDLEKSLRSPQNQAEAAGKLLFAIDLDNLTDTKISEVIESLQKLREIRLQRIEDGSVVLVLEGSKEGILQLEEQVKSGQLTEIAGIPVQDFVRVEPAQPDTRTEMAGMPVEEVHADSAQPARALVNFSQWLQGIFENGWQALGETQARELGFAGVRDDNDNVRAGKARAIKLIDLGVRHPLRLVVVVIQNSDQTRWIWMKLSNTVNQELPKNLKIVVFDDDKKIVIDEKQVTEGDCPPITLDGTPGEHFSIQITLKNMCVIEEFVI